MKKFLTTALLLTTFATAHANTVAVWNSQQAIANSNYAKAKLASIQASLSPKQQQLQTYKANIERIQSQYNQQKDKITPTQKSDMERQIKTNIDNYEMVAGQIENLLGNAENDIMQHISPVIKGIQDSIVKQKNIDVLIDNRDRTVTFVKPEWDITQDFIQKINEQVK